VLIWVAVRSYKVAPPIPENVVGTAGTTLFTQADILGGATGVSQARSHGEWDDLGAWCVPWAEEVKPAGGHTH